MNSGYHSVSFDSDSSVMKEPPPEDQAKHISTSAAAQIEDMRQTAKARVQDHMSQAERFATLADAHRHAAQLWSQVAESGLQGQDVPSENVGSRARREGF